MKTTEILSELNELRNEAVAFRLSRNVMDKNEFNKRIGIIVDGLDALIKGLKEQGFTKD